MLDSRHFWTYAQISLLLELSEGIPLPEIAVRIGKDEEAIKMKAAELGIRLPAQVSFPPPVQDHLRAP